MPDFEAVYLANKSRIALVGVDAGRFIGLGTVEQGKSLAAELGVTYPLATTSDATVIESYKVLGMPSTAFITPDGMIQRVWTGLLNEEIMTRLIEELLEASS
jgi:peroxiredoxin